MSLASIETLRFVLIDHNQEKSSVIYGNKFCPYTKITMCVYENNYFVYQNNYFIHQNNSVGCFLRVKACFKVFIQGIMFHFGSCYRKE